VNKRPGNKSFCGLGVRAGGGEASAGLGRDPEKSPPQGFNPALAGPGPLAGATLDLYA